MYCGTLKEYPDCPDEFAILKGKHFKAWKQTFFLSQILRVLKILMLMCLLFVCQIPEDDEVFSVRLTGVAGGALLRPNASSVKLRIRRNDSPLRFSHSIMAVPESAGVIALNVTRGRLTEDGQLVGSVDTEVPFYESSYFFT